MSSGTNSNSNPLESTRPETRPHAMNASSGSAEWPMRISTGSSLVPPPVLLSRFWVASTKRDRGPRTRQVVPEAAHCDVVAKPGLTDAIQDYLREIYKLGADGGRVSVTA